MKINKNETSDVGLSCSHSADTECGVSAKGEDSTPVAALKRSSEEELEVRHTHMLHSLSAVCCASVVEIWDAATGEKLVSCHGPEEFRKVPGGVSSLDDRIGAEAMKHIA